MKEQFVVTVLLETGMLLRATQGRRQSADRSRKEGEAWFRAFIA